MCVCVGVLQQISYLERFLIAFAVVVSAGTGCALRTFAPSLALVSTVYFTSLIVALQVTLLKVLARFIDLHLEQNGT